MWQIFPSISDILMKRTRYFVILPNKNNRKIDWNILIFGAIFSVSYEKLNILAHGRTNICDIFSDFIKEVTRDSNNRISDKLLAFDNYNTHNNVNI